MLNTILPSNIQLVLRRPVLKVKEWLSPQANKHPFGRGWLNNQFTIIILYSSLFPPDESRGCSWLINVPNQISIWIYHSFDNKPVLKIMSCLLVSLVTHHQYSQWHIIHIGVMLWKCVSKSCRRQARTFPSDIYFSPKRIVVVFVEGCLCL